MFKMFSIVTLLGLATISAAHAQSSQPIQAKVPFAFQVQDRILPAGSYQLTYNNSGHILTLRRLDQRSVGAYVTAAPADVPGWSSGPGKLLFRCYGKSCYLARVWQGRLGDGRALDVHPTEHERVLGFATRLVSITIPAQ